MLSRFQNDGKPLLPLNELQLQLKAQVDQKVKSGHFKFESVDCPCCNKREFEQIAEKDRYGLYYPVVICKTCGLVQTNPRMTQESYNEFYNVEYRRLYGGSHDPAKHFHDKQYPRGKAIYRFLEQHNLLPSKAQPFVLDIGCGGGGTIKYFAEKGWKVKGTDLGAEFIEYGRNTYNLDLEIGTIRDLKLTEKPDLIIYSHVMEHVLDPNGEISIIKNLCHENTVVYIEVPGVKNLHVSYARDLLLYLQNAHVYHYSLTTLHNLFSKNGFVLHNGTEFVRSAFRLDPSAKPVFKNDYESVKNYLTQLEKSRKVHALLPKPVSRLLSALKRRMGIRN